VADVNSSVTADVIHLREELDIIRRTHEEHADKLVMSQNV